MLFPDGAWTVHVYKFQFPHKWLIGSQYDFHIHALKATAAAGNVDIKWKYFETPIGQTLGTYNTLAAMTVQAGTVDSAQHSIWSSGLLTPNVNANISTNAIFWIERDARAGNATDTYAGGLKILDADLHMQFDSLGSRTIIAK